LITRFLALLLLAGSAFAQTPPIIIGAVVSQTGANAGPAEQYGKALQLWQEQTNAAGGLLGRRVDLRLLDDGSDATRAGPLYAQLIRDNADALIGPYGSAATLIGAAEAERARRHPVDAVGADQAVHRRGPRYLFQTTIPYAAYGAGVMELVKAAGYKRVFLLTRDDPGTREMAEGAREAAAELGLETGELEVYRGLAAEFDKQVSKAQAARAQAWIAFGEVRDSADMVRTLKRLEYAPPFFFARASAEPRFIKLVGQDAEFALGVRSFNAAAEAHAAGTVLAEAIRRAGSVDSEKLRAILASLEMETVLGGYKVDPATGAQIAAKPAVVQIIKGRPQIVWPERLRAAAPVLPYPEWNQRKLLKR